MKNGIMRFEGYRIITNGERFRIEGSYKPSFENLQWILLSKEKCYFGSDGHGFSPSGPPLEFDSKENAVKYIKEQFGTEGYRMLLKNWIPC